MNSRLIAFYFDSCFAFKKINPLYLLICDVKYYTNPFERCVIDKNRIYFYKNKVWVNGKEDNIILRLGKLFSPKFDSLVKISTFSNDGRFSKGRLGCEIEKNVFATLSSKS